MLSMFSPSPPPPPTHPHTHTHTHTHTPLWSQQRSISLISFDTLVIGFSCKPLMNMYTHTNTCTHTHTHMYIHTHTHLCSLCWLGLHIQLMHLVAFIATKCIPTQMCVPRVLILQKCFTKTNSILSQIWEYDSFNFTHVWARWECGGGGVSWEQNWPSLHYCSGQIRTVQPNFLDQKVSRRI